MEVEREDTRYDVQASEDLSVVLTFALFRRLHVWLMIGRNPIMKAAVQMKREPPCWIGS